MGRSGPSGSRPGWHPRSRQYRIEPATAAPSPPLSRSAPARRHHLLDQIPTPNTARLLEGDPPARPSLNTRRSLDTAGKAICHLIVRRQVRKTFAHLSAGDYHAVLPGIADDVHHRFAGDHPLSGERHDRAGVEQWFKRLFRLFPQLTFEVHRITVSGPPWDLPTAVTWTARVTPAAGPPYHNHGAHLIRIRRGHVKELYAYEDSQAVARACAIMLEQGIDEAGAAPILS